MIVSIVTVVFSLTGVCCKLYSDNVGAHPEPL